MHLHLRIRSIFCASMVLYFVPSKCVQYVTCNGSCRDHVLLSEPSLKCVYNGSVVPWSSAEERTAPSPNWMDASWYIYQDDDGKKAIALNLTWSQSAKKFESLVTGYYINVGKTALFGTIKYVYTFQNKTNIKSGLRSKIYFNSICIGRENPTFILPGQDIFINLHALPMYQEHTIDQSVDIYLSIPDCFGLTKTIKDTSYCIEQMRKKDEEYTDDNTDFEDYDTNVPTAGNNDKDKPFSLPFLAAIAAAIGTSVAIVVLCLGYCAGTKCKPVIRAREKCLNIGPKDVKSCLVLVSTAQTNVRSVYSEAVALLANIVQQHGRLKVECNLWELTGMEDPVNWMSEKLQKFQNIVLVCTPSGKQNMIRDPGGRCGDPFVMAMRVLMKRCKTSILSLDYNQTFTVVYFDSSAAVCVPDEVLRTSVKCYRLMPNFKEVFCRISGRRSDVIPPPVIETLNELTNKIVSLSITPSALTDKTIDPECCGLMECEARYATVSTWTTVDQKKRHCSSCPHAEQEEHSDNVPVTPFDSGFSGASTCTCDNSSHSCKGSQCSCVLDTMSGLSIYENYRSSHSETKF